VKPQDDLLTIELHWNHLMPEIELPPSRFLRSWLRWYSVENILEAITKGQNYTRHRGITDHESVGKIVSSILRREYSDYQPEEDRALYFADEATQ
jgi:hypothetical protein